MIAAEIWTGYGKHPEPTLDRGTVSGHSCDVKAERYYLRVTNGGTEEYWEVSEEDWLGFEIGDPVWRSQVQ